MDIIIVGCGKVGYTIARYLSEEKNNLVLIDKKIDTFDKIIEAIDVMVIQGNGLSVKTLIEAGVKTADLIICVTSSDETNILCCLTAKKLGVKGAIARVRDPEYALELSRLKRDLGLDIIINPEQQAALEISRLLRFPTAADIDTFANGRVELVSFRVNRDMKIKDKLVSHIFERIKIPVLLTTVERGGGVLIPHGDLTLREDDLVWVIGRPTHLYEFFREIGIHTEKIKDILIIGGGRITYYVAEHLSKQNIKIKIIEIDDEKCHQLSEALPNCLIIKGDGTDEDILNSENIHKAGAVICLTDRDEENVVVALYSKHCGVSKIITKINHINVNLVKSLGIGSVICPKNTTAYQIIRYVRGLNNSSGKSNIQTMYKVVESDGYEVEALEFNVNNSSKCLLKPLKDLQIKDGILIGCIVRSGGIIIPTGTSVIHDGDSVIVIAKDGNLNELDDILET